MEEKTRYFVLKQKAVPEVLLKVVEAKRLLESGKVTSVLDATEAVGIDLFNAFVFIELPECLLEGLLCGFAGRCFFAHILLPLLSLFYSFLLFYHRADWYTRRLQGISKLWDCRLKIAENKTIIIYKSP